jgi:hypothetical protein
MIGYLLLLLVVAFFVYVARARVRRRSSVIGMPLTPRRPERSL